MSLLNLITEAQLAEELGITLDHCRRLRAKHGWACVRPSRKVIRYTEHQVALIIDQMTQRTTPKVRPPASSGRTSRSRAMTR